MSKILVSNSGGIDSAMICRKLQEDGFEVYSYHTKIVEQLGSDEMELAARETANRYCGGRHYVRVKTLGYCPNNYENADHFTMYDEVKDIMIKVDTLPATANEGDFYEVAVGLNGRPQLFKYEGGEFVNYGQLWSGEPNLGMIIMAESVGYAKTQGINEVCGGFAGQRSPDMYAIYNQSAEANLNTRWRPKYIAPYGSMTTDEALVMTGYSREDFDWVVKSVPQGL